MWNNRRRLEELVAKLSEQITQLQGDITELRSQADEQKASQQQSKSVYDGHLASLQAQLDECARQRQDTEKLRSQIEELADVNRGLERGVTRSKVWQHFPPDDIFWKSSHEPRRPFVIPFTPEMDLRLWITHARFPTLPKTALVLPRSYARRAFVRITKSPGGTAQTIPIPDSELDKLPVDGYVALRLSGYAAPPTWIEKLLALKSEQDMNMWLVWFIEERTTPIGTRVRVAVACPKHTVEIEPALPAEWSTDQVIYFERHPSEYVSVPLPETPVVADDPSGGESESVEASVTSAD